MSVSARTFPYGSWQPVRAVLLRVCGMQLVLAYTPIPEIQPSIIVPALKSGRMPTSPKQVRA